MPRNYAKKKGMIAWAVEGSGVCASRQYCAKCVKKHMEIHCHQVYIWGSSKRAVRESGLYNHLKNGGGGCSWGYIDWCRLKQAGTINLFNNEIYVLLALHCEQENTHLIDHNVWHCKYLFCSLERKMIVHSHAACQSHEWYITSACDI